MQQATEKIKEKVKELISKSELEKAFAELRVLYKDNLNKLNLAIQIESDFNRLKKEGIKGIITHENRTISYALVTARMLDLIGLRENVEESIVAQIIEDLETRYKKEDSLKLEKLALIKSDYISFAENIGVLNSEEQAKKIAELLKRLFELTKEKKLKSRYQEKFEFILAFFLKKKNRQVVSITLISIVVISLIVYLFPCPVKFKVSVINKMENDEKVLVVCKNQTVEVKNGVATIKIPQYRTKKLWITIKNSSLRCQCYIDVNDLTKFTFTFVEQEKSPTFENRCQCI